MSLPHNSPYRPHFGVAHRPVLAALRLLGAKQLAQKWIRVSHPEYAWPLHGGLAGHRLIVKNREEFQYLSDDYETHTLTVIERLVHSKFVCADIGAHIGYTTLLLAKLAGPEGYTYAFEALPDNAALLQRNVELNDYTGRVAVENFAVIDRTLEQLTLQLGRSSFESTTCCHEPIRQVRVPATALDDYFKRDSKLDFVKMDIEGAEVQALEGMKRLLTESRPIVLLEVHANAWAALDQLAAAKYDLCDVHLQPTNAQTMRKHGHYHCVAFPREASRPGRDD